MDNFLKEAFIKITTTANDFNIKYPNYGKGVMQPTSIMAKKSVDSMSIMEKVLCELQITEGTDDELEQRMELRHQTLSSCRRQCVKKGWVTPTGDTRPTRSGRQANVWCLTTEGYFKVKEILK
tara:strand:+ start:645 stop:1013 length:369 start_codon:yes stop_codon:yes gene_type:complete